MGFQFESWCTDNYLKKETGEALIASGFDIEPALKVMDSTDVSKMKLNRGQAKLLLAAVEAMQGKQPDNKNNVGLLAAVEAIQGKQPDNMNNVGGKCAEENTWEVEEDMIIGCDFMDLEQLLQANREKRKAEAMENENTTVFRSVRRRLQARSSGRKIGITVAEIKKAVETHGMTYTAVEGFLRSDHAKRKELQDELRAHGVVLHNGKFEENPLAMLTREEAGEVLDAIKLQMATIPSEGLKETLMRRIEASVGDPDLVPIARKVVSDVCSVLVMATEDESLELFEKNTNGLGTGILKCLMKMVKDMVDEQG